MKEEILSFFIGMILGSACGVFKLPIPAPPTLAGLLGITGVFAGWWVIRLLGRS